MRLRPRSFAMALPCLVLLLATPVLADGGVVFHDIALDPASGIAYERVHSPRIAVWNNFNSLSPIPLPAFGGLRITSFPQKPRGNPGVVLFDYDRDGDLDIYVTNGPGAANSLYQNQFAQTGSVTFVDVGVAAGVGATAHDSAGVCFGDIDNDGDADLYVTGAGVPNLLFENQGNGTFADISTSAGIAGDGRYANACSMGDVDNNGLLDIYVGNTYDNWNHRFGHIPIWNLMEHNYLFVNQGGNVFSDDSNARGVENLINLQNRPGLTGAGFTWALTTVDLDLDGDLDIISADNQGLLPRAPEDERGWLRVHENDGTGHFTDTTPNHNLDVLGAWMGVDTGDLDCNGYLDIFATDMGYVTLSASRWFYGGPAGFTDSEAGDLMMTPFGWGTSIFDYDNDGDSDIIFHGGMDLGVNIEMTNPGALLVNEGVCSGDFDYDAQAIPRDHRLRTVQGVAVGDLNQDGFEDMVSVSSFNVVPSENFRLVVGPGSLDPTGSPFDSVSAIEQAWLLDENLNFVYQNPTMVNGDLSIELSSGDNGNGWAEITVRGGVGVHETATVNRDGIGAVVSFTPENGPTSMRPITGGASYASQDALPANFGLGSEAQGTVNVLWPGGVKNRLYDVEAGERVLFPEIPCSFDADWSSRQAFRLCVRDALKTYRHPSVSWISNPEDFKRFEDSMLRAYDETQ